MRNVPNLKTIQDLAKGIDEEFQIESRLKRYETLNPELIEFAADFGISDPKIATPALFVADYVVTSSEVPQGTSDEERRESIFKSFSTGLKDRCSSADALMRVFYLSQKTATLIRRNNSFLAGRGLNQDTGMVILKDGFLTPYLAVSSEILTEGKAGWELALLSSALKQTFPHEEIDDYLETPNYDNDKDIFPFVQRLLNEYIRHHNAEINTNLVIPNILETSIVFITKPGKASLVSMWSQKVTKKKWLDDEVKTVVNPLLSFLNKSDDEKPLIYVRGKIINSDDKLMLVRNPFAHGKPITLIRTPADELNVSKILTTLELRSLEAEGWDKTELVEVEVKQKAKSPKKPIEKISKEIKPEAIQQIPKKKGFFSRLKGRFRKKPAPLPVTEVKSKKIKKPAPKKEKKKKFSKKRNFLPSFLSHNIGVEAVGDLELYEIFDTFRESQYLIIGALESNFTEGITTFLTEPELGNPEEIAEMLDGLDEVIESAANHYFEEDHQIIPTEILFVTKDDKRYIICLDGNEKRIVGTIAITYVKEITEWRKDQELLQRRSLHMRTGQLLAARQHTPFDQAIERIYASTIDKDAKFIELDHAILPIE